MRKQTNSFGGDAELMPSGSISDESKEFPDFPELKTADPSSHADDDVDLQKKLKK